MSTISMTRGGRRGRLLLCLALPLAGGCQDRTCGPRPKGTPRTAATVTNGRHLPVGAALARKNWPAPPFVAQRTLVVRQALFHRPSRSILTEESDVESCPRIPDRGDGWKNCVARPGHGQPDLTWLGNYHLRVRSASTGRVVARPGSASRPLGRLLGFDGHRALELGPDGHSLTLRDFGRKTRRRIQGWLTGGQIRAAAFIAGTDLVALVEARRSGHTRQVAVLRLWDPGHPQGFVESTRFSYQPKRFLAPWAPRLGMWHHYVHDLCRTGDPAACRRLEGRDRIRYERWLPRDAGIDLAVSGDGSQVAAYVFGAVHLFMRLGRRLRRKRVWRDVFYLSRDWLLREPRLAWSPGDRALVLHGRDRLRQVIDIESGRLWPLKDRDRSSSWVNATSPRPVAVGFDSGTIYYLSAGNRLRRMALSGGPSAEVRLPPDLGRMYWVGLLARHGDRLIGWSGGSLWIVAMEPERLVARIGLPVARVYDDPGGLFP